MAYLKKAYRILMERIDKELKMPQGWYFFVKKQKEKQRENVLVEIVIQNLKQIKKLMNMISVLNAIILI